MKWFSSLKDAPFTTGCGGMACKLTYVLIQACTGLDGDDLEGYDRWMIHPGLRQGIGAARREAVRSREWASPADLYCRDERLFSVGAAASNNRLLLHPFPHPPFSLHLFLSYSPASHHNMIYFCTFLHVYPVAMVTQC